jgi:DNA-nicking Smr family endonuclease
MKSEESAFAYNPFENLNELMNRRLSNLCGDQCADKSPSARWDEYDDRKEETIFLKAMEGIRPIRNERTTGGRTATVTCTPPKSNDGDVLRHLRNLVTTGEGFIVADTPEYMEGTGYGVRSDMARRLHHGEFSIQDHINLHGLTTGDAYTAFEGFLKESVLAGKRAIMVIHGRGRSSPREPIIKHKVVEWITGGPWRKWVMAFSSARSCDGGAGAMYILLRGRPVTKRHRRRSRRGAQRNGSA